MLTSMAQEPFFSWKSMLHLKSFTSTLLQSLQSRGKESDFHSQSDWVRLICSGYSTVDHVSHDLYIKKYILLCNKSILVDLKYQIKTFQLVTFL